MNNCRIRILLALTLLLTAMFMMTIHEGYALSWSGEIRLTTDPSLDGAPAMVETQDGKIWMFWHTNRNGNMDIYHKIYNGVTWSSDTPFITDSNSDVEPTVLLAQDGTLWFFWASDRLDPGRYKIFYKTSSDNGTSWSADTQLTYLYWTNRRPSVMQAQDGKIWAVWHGDNSETPGIEELYYSTYNGATWSYPYKNLTYNTVRDTGPSIIQAQNGKIWLFWSSYRQGNNFELYYKTSIDNGASWSGETQLTTQNSWDEYPSAIQTRDGKIWVVWQADRGGVDYDIFYKTYNGAVWSSDQDLVRDQAEDLRPSIYQTANTTIWVPFASSRFDDMDIFYKVTLNEHDVAVTGITPTSNHIYRDYGSQIKVTVRNFGLNIETFTVTAYNNSAPFGTQTVNNLAPGNSLTLTFTWDTTGLACGYYTLSATASTVPDETDFADNSFTDGAVMVTIPGDANGDKTVNILDVSEISAHWYPGPPMGPLGYALEADINRDGSTNILDVGIMNSYWGQSW